MATANDLTTTTPAAPPAPRQLTIRDQLRSPAMLEQIRMALPQHMKPERMIRVAMTALTRTPELASCDQPSFFRCLLDLSAWGLEPDGRHAHLIPFRNTKRNCVECQLIVDYKGLVQLAYRSGYVKSIHADIVRAGDWFEYNRGDVERHTPWVFRTDTAKPQGGPGELIAAYCRVVLADGAVHAEAMTKADVDRIRSRSKAGRSGPWVTDYEEMAKKTVFRRVSKWIPISAEIIEAFDRDFDRVPEASEEAPRVASSRNLDELAQRLLGGATAKPDGPSLDASESQEAPADDDGEQEGADYNDNPSAATAEELADDRYELGGRR